MKKLLILTSLLISGSLWAEDELPKYLYCEFGKTSAEFHFNDEGENWFSMQGTNYDKVFSKKTIIKKLKFTSKLIKIKERFSVATGQIQIDINRITGGIIVNIEGSGKCTTVKPNMQRKF